MMAPRILGFIAVAVLVAAYAFGHGVLGKEASLRKAILALLYCSLAGLATSFIRAPLVIWPLGVSILGALIFLVWAMHAEIKRKRFVDGGF